jgi:heat shock protein HtpX
MAHATVGLKTHIWNNRIKAALLLLIYPIVITPLYLSVILFVGLFVSSGDASFWETYWKLVTDYFYAPYLLIFAMLAVKYWFQHGVVEDMNFLQPITRRNNPSLHTILEQLCISRGVSVPLFLMRPSISANAYAGGFSSKTAYIVVTKELLERFSDEEIEAVLAHELSHIMNGDTTLMFMISELTGVIRSFARSLVPDKYRSDTKEGMDAGLSPEESRFGFFGSLLAAVITFDFKLGYLGMLMAQAMVSRRCEYIADAGAIELTKNPQALISALKKSERFFFGTSIEPEMRLRLFHDYKKYALFTPQPSIGRRIEMICQTNKLTFDYQPETRKRYVGIKHAKRRKWNFKSHSA